MRGLLSRLGVCLAVFGFCLYSYLEAQNKLTELKIHLPDIDKEVRLLQEENRKLAYEIDRFQSPAHLIELVSFPEFSHLKHPVLQEILTVSEALAFNEIP